MSTEKKIQLINPKREPLTPEKLGKLSGLNLSDEQAEEAIWALMPGPGFRSERSGWSCFHKTFVHLNICHLLINE